jgi:hypothetical protein
MDRRCLLVVPVILKHTFSITKLTVQKSTFLTQRGRLSGVLPKKHAEKKSLGYHTDRYVEYKKSKAFNTI